MSNKKAKERAKARKAAREEDFKNQNIQKASDFNFDQHNRKNVKGTHVSGQEVRALRMNNRDENGRAKLQENYDALKAQKDAGATFGKRAENRFNRMGRRLEARQGRRDARAEARQAAKEKAQEVKSNPVAPTPTPTPAPTPAPTPTPTPTPTNNGQVANNTGDIEQSTEIKNTQEQNVKQDNDITTDINGNNNTVFNNQDNSIRQYGGDNRSMVINEANTGNQSGSGSSGGYYNAADKAISMATLGGFYDVDDSPAARASFVDQSVTMNRDNQKRYAGMGLQTAAQYTGFRGGDVNMENLQSSIDSAGQKFRDMATIQEVKTYGDRAAVTNYPAFEFGDPIDEVTSNAGDIADDYKDDIDDL